MECVNDNYLLRQIKYDGHKFTKDNVRGYYLSTRKVSRGRRVRLHVYVWEKHNGKIPAGFQVHHKDFNKENNNIENLMLIKMSEHMKLHSVIDAKEHYEGKRERFMKFAHPKAIEWHKSEEGREWHSKHAFEIARKIKNSEPRVIICEICGKQKETHYRGQVKYCSKKCKAKALRIRFKQEGRDYEYGRTRARSKGKVN